MKRLKRGGGWQAIRYTLRMANRVGWLSLWKAMRSKNACKTCALGMGGQRGGMVNEAGHFPEVCKKSFQAMVADMQAGLKPEFFRTYSIRQLQTLSSRELEHAGRLTEPLYAGPDATHYQPISWDEALTKLADRLKATEPGRAFFYASGRSSNEAGFVLQLLARLAGSNFVNNCSFYCHQASGVGLIGALGTGTATVTLDDVEKCDLYVLLGGNPASNHPRLMRSLMTVRRRGGRVIVVNPVKEVGLVNFAVPSDVWSMLFGSPIASLYVQPHIGGDLALLTGVAKRLLERGEADSTFIEYHTEGFDAYARSVRDTPWDQIEQTSGVERETIEQFAEMYAAAKNVVFGWTMGITHHEHGVNNVRAIINLALLRGMVGRPRAGLMPIRGHSNVQGIGSMGVAPTLKEKVLLNLEAVLGVKLPTVPGLDTMACVQAAERGEMDAAVCLGGNLYGSSPDSAFAARALGKIGLVTYLSTTLNTGHAHGRGRETLILPVLARDEEPHPTIQESMFNFVRLSDGGPARHHGPRSETEILATLARRMLGDSGPVDWKAMENPCKVREWIARVVPGYEQAADIEKTKTEFQIPGRTLHAAKFPTPSGKARFSPLSLPPLKGEPGQLRLMTVRSEGQFNSVVYEEYDVYRAQDRRDVILLNAADIARLGLSVNQRVTVKGPAGEMPGILVREFDIREGNALMYYPEANVLVPNGVDPESKTPAFKNVPITVEPEGVTMSESNGRIGLRVFNSGD